MLLDSLWRILKASRCVWRSFSFATKWKNASTKIRYVLRTWLTTCQVMAKTCSILVKCWPRPAHDFSCYGQHLLKICQVSPKTWITTCWDLWLDSGRDESKKWHDQSSGIVLIQDMHFHWISTDKELLGFQSGHSKMELNLSELSRDYTKDVRLRFEICVISTIPPVSGPFCIVFLSECTYQKMYCSEQILFWEKMRFSQNYGSD